MFNQNKHSEQPTWQIEEHDHGTMFNSSVYEAISAGQNCAIARKDKTAIETFKQIIKRGNIDSLTSREQSFIRIWYLRSLEN